jgi:DNA replication protein DnaC
VPASTGLSTPNNKVLSGDVVFTIPDETYNCSVCHDMMIVHPIVNGKADYKVVVPCRCTETPEAKSRKTQRLMKYCRLPDDTENRTFETFDAYTSQLQECLQASKSFTPDGKYKALVIGGPVDRGKSHLAIAVCRAWLALDIPARYVYVPWMLDGLRAAQFKEGEESYYQQMAMFQTVPLLCLDDLSAESPTGFTREKITTIIQIRWESGLHTLVTVNKPLDALPGDDEGRIGSRLRRYAGDNIVGIEDCGEYSLHKDVK